MKKTLIIILLVSLIFVLGMRRYSPMLWRTVAGGIEYALGNVTIGTGRNFTIGTTQWNSGDEIDGTKIKDADYGDIDVSAGGAWTLDTNSVADNEIDYANVTLADFDYETADKMFHSNNAGDVTEITLGANGTFLESNGATSAPAFRALAYGDISDISVCLLGTATLDVTSAAQTTIYTVPAGKRCILDHIKIVAGATASPTAVVSFGQNGAATDFLGNQTMTNLAAQYDTVICAPIPNATPVKTKSYAAATVIEADVTTADVDGGTDNTVYVFGTLY